MSTTVQLSLDTRRKKKDSSYPIVLRLSHQQRTISIQTGYSVQEIYWNKLKREIKRNYPGVSSVTRLNKLLMQKKIDALTEITKLDEAGRLQSMNTKAIKDYIVNQESSMTFFRYTERLIQELKRSQRIGNARVYKNVLGALKSYRKNHDLAFPEITFEFLKGYEAYYLGNGYTINGLAFNMRTIRAIYNRAIKEGFAERSQYPFEIYKIRKEATRKRAIDIESIKKIAKLDLKEGTSLFNARNYFVASYLMHGMSFIDMAFLKQENIANGRIQYKRKKNSRLYDIKISDKLNAILKFYTHVESQTEFIFPILPKGTLEMQYASLHLQRKQFNTKLSELAQRCGIDEHLTSYVSRHSFATEAKRNDVPLEVVSTMLGHSSLATTEIYLKSLPNEVIDSYADLLSDF